MLTFVMFFHYWWEKMIIFDCIVIFLELCILRCRLIIIRINLQGSFLYLLWMSIIFNANRVVQFLKRMMIKMIRKYESSKDDWIPRHLKFLKILILSKIAFLLNYFVIIDHSRSPTIFFSLSLSCLCSYFFLYSL